MSLENAISDHAAAIRELAAAISKAGSTVTTTHKIGDVSVTKTVPDATKPDTKAGADKAEAKPDAKKDTPAEKKTAATDKPGATPPVKKDASSIDYAATIKPKILEFAKQPEGREKLTALLARFGVTKGPDLTAEQHVKFDADITRAMAGEFDPRDAEEHEDTQSESAEDDMA